MVMGSIFDNKWVVVFLLRDNHWDGAFIKRIGVRQLEFLCRDR
ncbi:hypothetical protein TC_0191 [Chlamydia muridarum str. Nigg]|uniref:Uncharacterized protein n=1 Tax=Chlamydia muridarum (strain MoPn / Nigg) TaxID=243161 RepID=Q9PLB6_CHLMU|nr:hypothetical protein TC_0191 [Chlamydia muridarum str. Nigg]